MNKHLQCLLMLAAGCFPAWMAAGDGKNVIQLNFSDAAPTEVTIFASYIQDGKSVCHTFTSRFFANEKMKKTTIKPDSQSLRALVIQPGCQTIEIQTSSGSDGQNQQVLPISCVPMSKIRLKMRFVGASGQFIRGEKYSVYLDPGPGVLSIMQAETCTLKHVLLATGETDEYGIAEVEIPDYRDDEFLRDNKLIISTIAADNNFESIVFTHEGFAWPANSSEPLKVNVIRKGALEYKLASDWSHKSTNWNKLCRKIECMFVISTIPHEPMLPYEQNVNVILEEGSGTIQLIPGRYSVFVAAREGKEIAVYNKKKRLLLKEISLPETSILKFVASSNGEIVVTIEPRAGSLTN